MVLPNRASHTASQLVEASSVAKETAARRRTRHQRPGTVITLIGIETGTIYPEKETPVDGVGTALCGHLHLCTAEAAGFGIVSVRADLHVVDRILVGRDDGRTTPHRARGADTVYCDSIRLVLTTSGKSLRPVLGREEPSLRA